MNKLLEFLQKEDIRRLIDLFLRKKFNISVKYKRYDKDKKMYAIVTITNDKLMGQMCSLNSDLECHPSTNNRIAFIRKGCWQGYWSEAPIKLNIPRSDDELKFLFKNLKMLESNKGKKISSKFKINKWIFSFKKK